MPSGKLPISRRFMPLLACKRGQSDYQYGRLPLVATTTPLPNSGKTSPTEQGNREGASAPRGTAIAARVHNLGDGVSCGRMTRTAPDYSATHSRVRVARPKCVRPWLGGTRHFERIPLRPQPLQQIEPVRLFGDLDPGDPSVVADHGELVASCTLEPRQVERSTAGI